MQLLRMVLLAGYLSLTPVLSPNLSADISLIRAQTETPPRWGLRLAAGLFPAGPYLAGEVSYRSSWLDDSLELFAGYGTTPLELNRHSLFAGLRYYVLSPTEANPVWDPYVSLSSNLILGPQGGWFPVHFGLGTAWKLNDHLAMLWTVYPISLQFETSLKYSF